MDTLTWVLFESPLVLGVICGLTLFVLLVRWRSSGKAMPFLIGLGLAVLLLFVQAVVVTQREHARRIMAQVERGVLESRAELLGEVLSDDFLIVDRGWDKQEFMDLVRRRLREIRVHSLTRRAFQKEQEDPAPSAEQFDLEVSYLADVAARDYAGGVPSRWRITFVREGDEWGIVDIQPVMLNLRKVSGWGELR